MSMQQIGRFCFNKLQDVANVANAITTNVKAKFNDYVVAVTQQVLNRITNEDSNSQDKIPSDVSALNYAFRSEQKYSRQLYMAARSAIQEFSDTHDLNINCDQHNVKIESLFIEALNEIYENPDLVITFFNDANIHDFLNHNPKVMNAMSFFLETNYPDPNCPPTFRLEILSRSHEENKNFTDNKININSNYWFFEPLFKESLSELTIFNLTENGVNINGYLNKLQIKDILAFSSNYILNSVYRTSKKVKLDDTSETLNKDHLKKLFVTAVNERNVTVIFRLAITGIITPHELITCLTVEDDDNPMMFNENILMLFVKANALTETKWLLNLAKKTLPDESYLQFINAKNGVKKTALMYAADNGSFHILKLLLKEKAIDINAQAEFMSEKTALHLAADLGRQDKFTDKIPNKDLVQNKIKCFKLLFHDNRIKKNLKDSIGYKTLDILQLSINELRTPILRQQFYEKIIEPLVE